MKFLSNQPNRLLFTGKIETRCLRHPPTRVPVDRLFMHNFGPFDYSVWGYRSGMSSVRIFFAFVANLRIVIANLSYHSRGYLGAGGKQDMAKHMHCIGGATGYIDRMILGEAHIYQHPTARSFYDSMPFDPEGLVGCLTTFLQVFIGLQCGVTFMVYTEWKARVRRFVAWSVVLGTLGGILCFFSQDDGIIPINKNLWSLSFVFATSSLAFILLSVFYVVVDVRNLWSGTPLVYAGMNAIVMYVGHEVFHAMLPWHWKFGAMNTHFVLLLENAWNASLWVVIAYILYCKKIFISL